MAELEYFVVSESAVVDQNNNHVSLFCVLDELSPLELPAILPRCVAVASWTMSEAEIGGDFQASLTVEFPGDMPTAEIRANFTARTIIHRVFQRFAGMPVVTPGVIRFSLSLNGEHQASHKLVVHAPNKANIGDGTLLYGDIRFDNEEDFSPVPEGE